jgi:ADP-ribose pyrophosphatase YjhB (NUDIX family)
MNNGYMRGVLMRRERKTRHLGVYGVILNSQRDKILLIKKAKGPYVGLFDLPGGTPEFHESFEETLRREILEETGLTVKTCRQISALLNIERYNEIILRHVGIIYLVEAEGEIKEDSDGADSKGSIWIDIGSVKSDSCAPLVVKIVSLLKGELK